MRVVSASNEKGTNVTAAGVYAAIETKKEHFQGSRERGRRCGSY